MNSEQFYRQRIIYSPSELREAVIRLLKRRVSVEYLLDVGCSDGSFTYSIASAVGAKEIYGVDISEKAVAEALRRGIKAFKINVDVENLPFPDNQFDLVTAIELIEHLVNTDHFFIEVFRILKPRGFLVVSTPNLASWVNRLLLLFGYQPYFSEVSFNIDAGKLLSRRGKDHYEAAGHLRMYTLRALMEQIRFYGFRIVEVIGSHADYQNYVLRNLDRMFSKLQAYQPTS